MYGPSLADDKRLSGFPEVLGPVHAKKLADIFEDEIDAGYQN